MPLNDPVPSTAADVLERNAEDFDRFVVGTANTFVNRLGVEKLTITGIIDTANAAIATIEADGAAAINALRVVNAGSFEDGATLTARNEVLYYLAEQTYYRWDGALPKTVSAGSTPAGTGGVDVGAWVNVGQAELASALTNPAESGNRIARMPITADSLKDLANAPRIANRQYSVKGFYAGSDVGGGMFYWDDNRDKADHNGGTVVDPDRVNAWDGTQGDLATLFEVSEEGFGCYVRTNVESSICEWFGAVCDGSSDDSLSINKASAFARDRGLSLTGLGLGEGYLLRDNVTIYTECDIKSNVVYEADGTFRYIYIESTEQPDEIDFSTLSGLDEFSSSISGLSSYVGRYVWIESDEILTERNNPPSNEPYNKRSAFYVLSSDGAITPSLDASFSSGIVKVFKPHKKISVTIGGIKVIEAGGDANFEIVARRDSTKIEIKGIESEGPQLRTIVVINANDVELNIHQLNEAGRDSLGYGIRVSLSCNTIINASGALSRAELDGRHGHNVEVRGGVFKRAGSHWGNSYTFINCKVYEYNWAGKDLSIIGGEYAAIEMRGDVSLCTGTLRIDGAKKTNAREQHLVPTSTAIADFYSTPRRYFDEIIIDNLNIENSSGLTYIIGGYGSRNPDAVWQPQKRIIVDNVQSKCETRLYSLHFDNAIVPSGDYKWSFSNVQGLPLTGGSIVIRGFGGESPFGVSVDVKSCGDFWLSADANVFEELNIYDCNVVSLRRITATDRRGDIKITGGAYRPNQPSFIEARKDLIGVLLDNPSGSVSMGGATDGSVSSQIACRVTLGTSGYKTPIHYYVDTSVYEDEDMGGE